METSTVSQTQSALGGPQSRYSVYSVADKERLDAAMHEAVPAIAACGVSPLVRLPDMQGWMIKRMSCSTRCRKLTSWDLTLSVFQAHLTRELMGSVDSPNKCQTMANGWRRS